MAFKRSVGWLVPFIAIALVLLLSRCGSNSSSPASGTFSAVYQNTLGSATCTQCHQPNGAAVTQNGVQLDFTTQAKAYSSLNPGTQKVTGRVSSGSCGSYYLVSPKNPTQSYLLAVLFQDYATSFGCTTYFNNHTYNLSSAEESSIVSWINQGAQNN